MAGTKPRRKAEKRGLRPGKQSELNTARRAMTEQTDAEIIRAYLNRPLCQSRSAFIAAQNLDRSGFYVRMQRPQFRAGIDQADAERRAFKLEPVEKSITDVLTRLVHEAKGGNIRAIEIVLQLDNLLRPAGVSVQQNVVVQSKEDRPATVEAAFDVIEEQYQQAKRWKRLREIESGKLDGTGS